MSRSRVHILLAFALFPLLAVPTSAGSGNDTCATAEIIPPGTLNAFCFDTCPNLHDCYPDYDWYRITVPAGHELIAELTFGTETGVADRFLDLMDGGATGACPPTPIPSNGWPPATERLPRAWTNFDVVSHEIFLVVHISDANGSGYSSLYYVLHTSVLPATCAAQQDDAFEPNDQYPDANQVHDVTLSGLFVRYARPDVFRVMVPGYGSVLASAAFQSAAGDIDLYASGLIPETSTGTGDLEAVNFVNYYSAPIYTSIVAHIKLGHYGECNTYQLTIAVDGGFGTEYCPGATNSLGIGAHLFLDSAPRASATNWEWWSYGTDPGCPVLLYCGNQQTSVPFGDGLRCVAGTLFRLRTATTANPGHADLRVGAATLPVGLQFQAGSTWNFQTRYRDTNGPLGTGFNFSNGVSVTFTP